MGWKTSLIIIENPNDFLDEFSVLKAIGKEDYKLEKEVLFEDVINPRDKSISIGLFNGNIIISDDYQITTKSLDRAENLDLTNEEINLCKLFPRSEIVSIACHSVVNYHAYSLIQNGVKKRLKLISTDTPLTEFGQRTIEEEKLYKSSYQKEGANFWKDESDPDEDFAEEQMMENFTFEFAKRRLGVRIDYAYGDELFESTKFKKYLRPNLFKRILKSIFK